MGCVYGKGGAETENKGPTIFCATLSRPKQREKGWSEIYVTNTTTLILAWQSPGARPSPLDQKRQPPISIPAERAAYDDLDLCSTSYNFYTFKHTKWVAECLESTSYDMERPSGV